MDNQISTKTREQIGIKSYQALYMTKVYNWMALALVVTGVVAYITATTPQMIGYIVSSKLLFYGLILGELGLVIYLTASDTKNESDCGHCLVSDLFRFERIDPVHHIFGLHYGIHFHHFPRYGRYFCSHEPLRVHDQKGPDKHRQSWPLWPSSESSSPRLSTFSSKAR